MARPVTDFIVKLKVEYVPIPKDRIGAWRAGVSLLLQLLRKEREIYEAEVGRADTSYAWVLGYGTVRRIRLAEWSVQYARSTHG